MALEITREPDDLDGYPSNRQMVPVLPGAGGFTNGEVITATSVTPVESSRPPVIGERQRGEKQNISDSSYES